MEKAFVIIILIFVFAFLPQQKFEFMADWNLSAPSLIALIMLVIAFVTVIALPIRNYLIDRNKEEIESYAEDLKKVYITRSTLAMLVGFGLISVIVILAEGYYSHDLIVRIGRAQYPFDKVLLYLSIVNSILVLAENAELYSRWFKGFKWKPQKPAKRNRKPK